MFHFPYGNLHGLNLDWLLAEWKKFKDSFANAFTASTTQLPVSSAPQVDVTYDADTGIYNFDFGIPAEVKPQSFQIGYAESSSGTVIPTGITWLANPPAVAQGNYLWSRTMVIYNDGSYSATYACSRMGVDGSGTPATATPLMDGVGAVGTSNNFAREDHVHPSDTTKANVTALTKTTDITITLAANTRMKNATFTLGTILSADLNYNTDLYYTLYDDLKTVSLAIDGSNITLIASGASASDRTYSIKVAYKE